MKGLKTLAILGAAGVAAYFAYDKFFKKPSATTAGTTIRAVAAAVPQSTSGLSGPRPINPF